MYNEIPDEPKIKFENYLLDLIKESDRKEASVYVKNASNFVNEIWNDIVKSRPKRKLDVRKMIPEKLNMGTGLLYGIKNDRKSISIDQLHNLILLWKDYCNKSEKEMISKWNKLYNSDIVLSTHSKHHEVRLPKELTPKLSYLIGWMCGDGHFKEAHNFVIKISEKSIGQIELVLKPLFKELFNVDVPVFKRYMGGYAIQVGCKPLFRFLTKYLKIKVGEIPSIVYGMNEINKKHFLMGIFDSEGHVDASYKNSKIVISQANYDFLIKIMEFFKEIGIEFTGPHLHKTKLGEWYTIQIRKKSEILKFSRKMKSYHVDKRKKIDHLVMEIEKNRCS